MDYFTLFNLPKKFNINKNLLLKNFYKLQLQFHPDLFINDIEFKRKLALEKSIQINKGYKILKNFLSRAIYFLSLNGFQIDKEEVFLKNNIFLTKYFSLYEELDDLKNNNFNKFLLNNFLEKINIKVKKLEKKIAIEFERKNFEKVIKKISELFFLNKIKYSAKQEQKIYAHRIN